MSRDVEAITALERQVVLAIDLSTTIASTPPGAYDQPGLVLLDDLVTR